MNEISTKGCGKTAPNEAETVDMNGVKVPIGKPKDTIMQQVKILYNFNIKINNNFLGVINVQ